MSYDAAAGSHMGYAPSGRICSGAFLRNTMSFVATRGSRQHEGAVSILSRP